MMRRLRPLRNDRGPRALVVPVLAGLMLVIAAVPASASAAVRTGTIQDAKDVPTKDALGNNSCGEYSEGAWPDIAALTVAFDEAGSIRATWTFYEGLYAFQARCPNNSVRIDTGIQGLYFSLGGLDSTTTSAGVYATYYSWQGWTATLSYGGASVPASVSMSSDGQTLTVEAANPALGNRDYRKVLIYGTGPADHFDAAEQLQVGWSPGFWFNGYKPVTTNPPPTYDPANPGTTGVNTPGYAPGAGTTTTDPAKPTPAKPKRVGMTINDEAQYTNEPNVDLSLVWPSGTQTVLVSNDGGFRNAKEIDVDTSIPWKLSESGSERLPKTVYIRFGSSSQTFTDDIILDQTKPTVSSAAAVASGTATTASVAHAAAAETQTYRVRIRAQDATSGVAKVQFARDKQHPSSLRKFARTTRYKAARAPRYLRVQDRAGNFSRWRSATPVTGRSGRGAHPTQILSSKILLGPSEQPQNLNIWHGPVAQLSRLCRTNLLSGPRLESPCRQCQEYCELVLHGPLAHRPIMQST